MVESRSNPVKPWKNLSEITQREKPRAPATDGLSVSLTPSLIRSTEFDQQQLRRLWNLPRNTRLSAHSSTRSNPSTQPLFDIWFHGPVGTKNCELDPVPTWIVKLYVNELAPFLAKLVNALFGDGSFPSTQKCTVQTHRLESRRYQVTVECGHQWCIILFIYVWIYDWKYYKLISPNMW